MITDSHGNPGIAGTTRGVVMLVEREVVTVTVLIEAEVLVDVLADVLD